MYILDQPSHRVPHGKRIVQGRQRIRVLAGNMTIAPAPDPAQFGSLVGVGMEKTQAARGGGGPEIAEAALVLPLVFMLLLGIVWFGRAFNIYSTVQQAAQQGAITAARSTCGTCGDPSNALPNASTVDSAVVAVLSVARPDTGQIKQWEANNPTPGVQSCPAPAPPASCTLTGHKIWVCSSVLLNSATQPLQCGAMVSVQYPFQSFLPGTSLNMQQIILSAQAQSRMEN